MKFKEKRNIGYFGISSKAMKKSQKQNKKNTNKQEIWNNDKGY